MDIFQSIRYCNMSKNSYSSHNRPCKNRESLLLTSFPLKQTKIYHIEKTIINIINTNTPLNNKIFINSSSNNNKKVVISMNQFRQS